MLGGDDNRVDADRLAVPIFDGDLGFPVGPDPRQNILFPNFGQASCEPMRQDNGHRHQFGGFIGGIAEHETLVASPAGSTPMAISPDC